MISVVIPLYNKEKQVKQTLRKVLEQTFSDYEIIIVNDGSTDSSAEIAREFEDHRIKVIDQENAGVSAARNRGIKEAKGNFIAFLDADDEWDKDYLAAQHQLTIDYPQCDVFATNYSFMDAKGRKSPTILNEIAFNAPTGIFDNYFEVASCSHPPLWTSAVMVRRSAINTIGGFPVGIKSGEDLLTWARLAVRFKIAYNTATLAAFVFDETAFDEEQRKRAPENIDYVGTKLAELYKLHPHITGLKTYNAMWHKMRARIFLSKQMRSNSIKECLKSMHYKVTFKIVAFMILGLLPYRITAFAFKKLG